MAEILLPLPDVSALNAGGAPPGPAHRKEEVVVGGGGSFIFVLFRLSLFPNATFSTLNQQLNSAAPRCQRSLRLMRPPKTSTWSSHAVAAAVKNSP